MDLPATSYLIVGLGNPGKEYAKARHNVGFWAIDELVESFKLPKLKLKKEWESTYVKTEMGEVPVVLLTPLTYMNLSGAAVQKAAHYFHIPPERIVVVQDDIDLPVGKLRIRQGGSSGGHNGIKSIIQNIGTDFIRVKIGVLPERGKENATDLVLSNFSKTEWNMIQEAIQTVPEIITILLQEGVEEAQNRWN